MRECTTTNSSDRRFKIDRSGLLLVAVALLSIGCVDGVPPDGGQGCEEGAISENEICLDGTWQSRDGCEPAAVDGDDPGRVCLESADCFGGSACARGDEAIGCCKYDGPTDVRFRNATGFAMEQVVVSWVGIEFEVAFLDVKSASEFVRYPRLTVVEEPDVGALIDGGYVEHIALNDIGTDFYLGRGTFEAAISLRETMTGEIWLEVGERVPVDP
jgi:hypothetical protein